MAKYLVIYPNLSKGGITSVIRARAALSPADEFVAIFSHDRGGRYAFDDLGNVEVRLVPKSRMNTYLEYLIESFDFDEAYVLSSPDEANTLAASGDLVVNYEFHSSRSDIVTKEINKLEVDRLARILVPSQEMLSKIKPLLPRRLYPRTMVSANRVDPSTFTTGDGDLLDVFLEKSSPRIIPLVWVGRFEIGKGDRYLPRILRALPVHYEAFVVASIEGEPFRVAAFLSECDALGVRDRVHILMDLSQLQMAELYRSVAKNHGLYVSTSLNESFGYAVSEALDCGLKAVAFDLPVWSRFESHKDFVSVPLGDTKAIAAAILQKYAEPETDKVAE